MLAGVTVLRQLTISGHQIFEERKDIIGLHCKTTCINENRVVARLLRGFRVSRCTKQS